MSKFILVKADDTDSSHHLSQMHHVRWKVFCKELNWTIGLYNVNCMEFDDYDKSNPELHYILRLNESGHVDAGCRIMPTNKPNMLCERYPDAITAIPLPKDSKTWEITRLFSDTNIRISQKKDNVISEMFIAAYEFALKNDIDYYISLTTEGLDKAFIKRGIPAEKIGPLYKIDNESCYALRYKVSYETLKFLRNISGINESLLFNI